MVTGGGLKILTVVLCVIVSAGRSQFGFRKVEVTGRKFSGLPQAERHLLGNWVGEDSGNAQPRSPASQNFGVRKVGMRREDLRETCGTLSGEPTFRFEFG